MRGRLTAGSPGRPRLLPSSVCSAPRKSTSLRSPLLFSLTVTKQRDTLGSPWPLGAKPSLLVSASSVFEQPQHPGVPPGVGTRKARSRACAQSVGGGVGRGARTLFLQAMETCRVWDFSLQPLGRQSRRSGVGADGNDLLAVLFHLLFLCPPPILGITLQPYP